MTEQVPQPPQDEEPVITATDAAHDDAVAAAEEMQEAADAAEQPEISYHEYLKLLNPDKSDAEIAKMIRKENRYVWIVRFQILAVIVFVCIILYFILSS